MADDTDNLDLVSAIVSAYVENNKVQPRAEPDSVPLAKEMGLGQGGRRGGAAKRTTRA